MSPNYFQKVLAKERGLTLPAAKQIAGGFGLSDKESRYWVLMVKLLAPRFKKKELIRQELESLRQLTVRKVSHDDSMHQSWLHSVIFEMANLPHFSMTPENIKQYIVKAVSEKDIQNSLDFLVGKKWLIPKDEGYQATHTAFDPKYDKRSIDMIKAHREYLDMAKHRLNDPATETEFIGLTVSSHHRPFQKIQEILRQAVDDVEEVAQTRQPDEVIALQISAFKVTRPLQD